MYFDIYQNLISYPDYGIPVVEGVFVIIGLSWLIFFLSKLVFKRYFVNKFWKAAFLTMIAVPSFIEIYIGSINALGADPLSMYFLEEELVGFPTTSSFNIVFSPIFAVFFITYLLHFVVRLMRKRKEKTLSVTE